MRLVTAKQIREIDRITIENYFTPARDLMTCAALKAVDVIKNEFPCPVCCAVVCGNGNNGGDGFVVARLLHNAGYDVRLMFDSSCYAKLSEESKLYHDLFCRINQVNPIDSNFDNYSFVVDANLGTGISGKARPEAAAFINALNSSSATVFSLDIPSGLPSDGYISPDCLAVKADFTITFGFPKVSMITRRGTSFCGIITVADIGFPPAEVDLMSPRLSLFNKEQILNLYNLYENDNCYKTQTGSVTVCGGFPGYEGASILALNALCEIGNGMTYCAVDQYSDLSGRFIPNEVILHRIKADISDVLSDLYSRSKHVICGLGLGRCERARSVFDYTLSCAREGMFDSLILDGDALYFLSKCDDLSTIELAASSCRLILTPHSMEASRLANVSVDIIDGDSVGYALELSKMYQACVVLKGPSTVTAFEDRVVVNTSGNSLLATAGSGDVLTGIIASLLTRFDDTLEAVSAAVFLHGYCADYYYQTNEIASYRASDTIEMIRPALRSLFNSIDDHG